jgi:hypothetical protein
MAINNGQCLVIVGLGIATIIAYCAYSAVDNPTMPQEEFAMASLNESLDACTEHEFFRAHQLTENQQLGFTPHRYPTITGGNVTSLIHHGLSPLRKPAPEDAKWITRPPAEVMW